MLRVGVFLLGLVLASPALAQAPAAPQLQPVTVKVEGGMLSGYATERGDVFKAVPYAAPPVGDLRWAPPRPVLPWKGMRDATANGPSCMQPMNPNGTPNEGGANGPMSEDCLQLNVFAPKGAKKAPVMVWIHGGSHRAGAGWVFDGSAFARDGVVLVTINYRLGPLGYFAHPALTQAAAADAVGNYGLMDQIAALKWVQKNIAAFGGDPAKVTVFGESAGGMSTLALLATTSARPLFNQAIVQSGGGWGAPVTLAQKEASGVRAAEALGLSAAATAAELRALPAEALIAKVDGPFGPFVDGKLMTQTPAQAFASGRAYDVPMIIGANSGEDSLLGAWKPAMAAMIPAAARNVYVEEAAKGDEALTRAVFGDRLMVAPARWIAAKAAGGKPAWLYHFSYVGSRFRPMGITRAFHAAEIQYVFEYWGRRTPMSLVSDEDKAMADLMHGCWVAFAKTGTPSCGAAPWPAYSPQADQLMEFGASSGVRTGLRKARLDAQEAAVLPKLQLGAN
jgi:para-nitrobenzyl esterase